MGKVMSMMSRKVQRFNVENRAHKAISREKPTAAPRHKISTRQLDTIEQADADFLEKHNIKDAVLDNRLKDVYLVSHVTEMSAKLDSVKSNRPLPQTRITSDDLEYGVYEPVEIPKGRATLRQIIKFITDHNTNPSRHTSADIAAQYKLSPETTVNILRYFKTLKLYIPDKKLQQTRQLLPDPPTLKDSLMKPK
ncbi:protein NDUFAF4 homolog [Athalia rosae]|uniref:protein NDUFAF4 homolog n=1 Tax=Athalia rosae TaxID=37344 RepID=UPI002034734C|nr:protein NDUFAF4 homolog [Athalia rosae]